MVPVSVIPEQVRSADSNLAGIRSALARLTRRSGTSSGGSCRGQVSTAVRRRIRRLRSTVGSQRPGLRVS